MIRIILKYKYLKYDIDQFTSRWSKMRIADEESKNLADTSGVEKSNNDLVRRWISSAVAELKSILKSLESGGNDDSDDTLSNDASWQIMFKELDIDSKAMAELLHWFVVRYCAWQWSKVFTPDLSVSEYSEYNGLRTKLKRLSESSAMPIKNKNVIPEDTIEITYGYE